MRLYDSDFFDPDSVGDGVLGRRTAAVLSNLTDEHRYRARARVWPDCAK